jgi:FkbM family methyltransferase
MRLMYPPKRSPLLRVLRVTGAETVLDIGANLGQTATRLRQGGFTGTIVSSEPLSDKYAFLTDAAADDPTWITRREAVGAAADEVELNVSGRSSSSSIRPMTKRLLELSPDVAYVGTERVPVVTAKQIVAEEGLDARRTVLKADVQGFEWEVLEGARDLLGDFAGVVVEMCLSELYEGQRLLPDLVTRLTAAGHQLWTIEPGHVDKVDARMLWCDGIFVRQDIADAASTHHMHA